MSRTYKDSGKARARKGGPSRSSARDRQLSVRSVRRDPPDLRKLSRAIITMALAEAEAEQAAAAEGPTATASPVDHGVADGSTGEAPDV